LNPLVNTINFWGNTGNSNFNAMVATLTHNFSHSWDPFYHASTSFYYQNSGYGQLRPAAVASGFGTSTSNGTFERAMNPNFGGNGTTFFVPPTFVPGPSFPATAPAPTPGIHRNSLSGPGYQDLDVSLAKAFGLPKNRVLGEGGRFELRADIYNLFNTTNINVATIDGSLGSVDPTGAVTTVNSHFGVAGAALGSRTIQLQARFSF